MQFSTFYPQFYVIKPVFFIFNNAEFTIFGFKKDKKNTPI